MSEGPSIPYFFTHIPNMLLTEDFLNDHEMMKFIVLMMRRISTQPTKVPLKSFCRHLDLDPFEFMFGRISFAKAAGISTKIARTRFEPCFH